MPIYAYYTYMHPVSTLGVSPGGGARVGLRAGGHVADQADGLSGQDLLAPLVMERRLQRQKLLIRPVAGHRDRDLEGVAQIDGLEKTEALVDVDRTRAGKLGSKERRDVGGAKHSVSDPVSEPRPRRIGLVEVDGVRVAGYPGELFDLSGRHGPRDRDALPDRKGTFSHIHIASICKSPPRSSPTQASGR